MLGFLIIALMRVVQSLCNKKASKLVMGKQCFFAYGVFYQFAAAVISFFYLWKVGFYGWNTGTILCSLCSAVFMAVCLFTGIEAMKGAPMAICTVFSMGGLFIPCILGIFLFDEPMGILQWMALLLFVVSIYLLTANGTVETKISKKTILILFLDWLANGLVMLAQKYYAVRIPDGNVAMYSWLMFCFSAFILLCFLLWQIKSSKKKPAAESEKTAAPFPKQLFLYGSALAVAVFVINLVVTMLAKTFSSVVLYTLSSLITIAISSLVGVVLFKEKMSLKNVIGIFLGVLAIVLSNIN